MNERKRVQKGVSTGGQFAPEARSEAAGVTLAAGNTQPLDRDPDQLLESPLTAYEVGRRIDNDYRIDGVVPVWMSEVQQGEQGSDEHIAGLLAEGGEDHLDDVSYEPVGIHEDGRILMLVSANAQSLVDDGFSDEQLQQLEAGVNAGKVRSTSSYDRSDLTGMSDLAIPCAGARINLMEEVPPLPEGFNEDDVYIDSDDDGNPMVGIELDGDDAIFAWAKSDGFGQLAVMTSKEDLQAGGDYGVSPEVEAQLFDYVQAAARNVAVIESEAVARLRANRSFAAETRKNALR